MRITVSRLASSVALLSLVALPFAHPAPAVAQEQRFADLGVCELESGEVLRGCSGGARE